MPISPCTKTAKHPIFPFSIRCAPGSGKPGRELSPAPLRRCPPCLAVPTFRRANPSRTLPGRRKRLDDVDAAAPPIRCLWPAAPLAAGPPAADRSRFSRRNKSKARGAGADLSRKRAGAHRAHGRLARRKDERELKAARRRIASGWVRALAACSLEKATRTRYGWMATRRRCSTVPLLLPSCRCRVLVRAKKGMVCAVQLKA